MSHLCGIPVPAKEVECESVKCDVAKRKPAELGLQSITHVGSSVTSLVDTPGDSGVVCLDSETSDATSTSFTAMTQSLADTEEIAFDVSPTPDKSRLQSQLTIIDTSSEMTRSDIDNQNISPSNEANDVLLKSSLKSNLETYDNLPDVILKALEAENVAKCSYPKAGEPKSLNLFPGNAEPKKSSSDDIVYRRRCKKKNQSHQSVAKKRVSFHEDILKSTRTDNIHIEHGFISYRNSDTYNEFERFKNRNELPDRYSWCATGDNRMLCKRAIANEQFVADALACVVPEADPCLSENTGVFEYATGEENQVSSDLQNLPYDSDFELLQDDNGNNSKELYMCDSNSSDSNLSCDSESSSSDTCSSNTSSKVNNNSRCSSKCDKTQKSYSCDCFDNNPRQPLRKMYFSEADMDHPREPNDNLNTLPSNPTIKSVLKKNRYIPTNIVEEHKIKKDNSVRSLIDSRNIMSSLKTIYKNFNLGLVTAERGVPEGSEDCHNVVEAVTIDAKKNPHKKAFLSKSFDTAFQVSDDGFVEVHLNERGEGDGLSKKKDDDSNNDRTDTEKEKVDRNQDSFRPNLTLDMKSTKSSDLKALPATKYFPDRNKYVVNGESLVYEHKGVSYCYQHDTFQTAFNTTQESFVPISDAAKSEYTNESSQQSCTLSKSVPAIEVHISSKKDSNVTEDTVLTTHRKLEKYVDTLSKYNSAQPKVEKHLQDLADSKSGVPKHLSSPKKQNIRYEKRLFTAMKRPSDEEQELDMNANGYSSVKDFNDDSTLTDDILEINNCMEITAYKASTNKSSLLNRYLKNVLQKKALEVKLQNNIFFQKKLKSECNKFPPICYPKSMSISKSFAQSAKKLNYLINKEVIENKRVSVKLLTTDELSYFDSFEENVAIECCEKLKLELFVDRSETLQRMLKVRSPYSSDGSWNPLLVFITNAALYVADVKHGANKYELLSYLSHDKLDTIAIGIDSQYVQVLERGGRLVCTLVTGDPVLTRRLAASLEWSARTSRPTSYTTPAALCLTDTKLRRALRSELTLDPLDMIRFYGAVCTGETETTCETSPELSGPVLEGYLMCRFEKQKHWQPTYFSLKSGVLYYGAYSPEDPPLHQLKMDSVLGVRRLCEREGGRPHCFEVAARASCLLLAACDDADASHWLQALLQQAAQALEPPHARAPAPLPLTTLPPGCSIVVTCQYIVLLRENLQHLHPQPKTGVSPRMEVLACGAIRNLTAFRIPNNDDNWCTLEFSVCEVLERGTAMRLLFDGAELERFIATVELLWHSTNVGVFPMSIVDAEEESSCVVAHSRFSAAWTHMLPAQT